MFPKGAKEYYSNSMRDWVSIDHQVEHVTGLAGEVSCGPGIDQDVAIWSTQHKGLRSRGYRGEYLPAQRGEYAISMRLLTATLLWTLHERR